jgi:hypothetical protein
MSLMRTSTALGAFYRRLAARVGKANAITARRPQARPRRPDQGRCRYPRYRFRGLLSLTAADSASNSCELQSGRLRRHLAFGTQAFCIIDLSVVYLLP